MISVKEFVDKYNKLKNKEEFLKDHLTNSYVNYEEKISKCKKIVSISMYKKVNDKEIFWINTPNQYYLFCLELIGSYTDINMESDEKLLKNYNELNKNGLISEIIKNISQAEYVEFKTILDMCTQDEIENVRSLPSFLETKMDAMKLGFDGMSDAFAKISKDPVIAEKIGKVMNFSEVTND